MLSPPSDTLLTYAKDKSWDLSPLTSTPISWPLVPMSNGLRRVDLLRSPNAGLVFHGPWRQTQEDDVLSGYTATASGYMKFTFEGVWLVG
jgi:hypothetical protein